MYGAGKPVSGTGFASFRLLIKSYKLVICLARWIVHTLLHLKSLPPLSMKSLPPLSMKKRFWTILKKYCPRQEKSDQPFNSLVGSNSTVPTPIVAGPLCNRYLMRPAAGTDLVRPNLRRLRPATCKVVIVDDSKPYRIKLRTMLQRLFPDVNIHICGSPKEGLQDFCIRPRQHRHFRPSLRWHVDDRKTGHYCPDKSSI
mgnify:CR=1 FL=1